MAIGWGVFVVAIGATIGFGHVKCYRMPTASMTPTLQSGDNIVTEGLSARGRKPQRGEVIVFRTNLLSKIGRDQVYVKRLVGLPGEHLKFQEGDLFINGVRTPVFNRAGEIHFLKTRTSSPSPEDGDFEVPPGQYFVMGDNSAHSADSRDFGCVPGESILGRVVYCYWPTDHAGAIR